MKKEKKLRLLGECALAGLAWAMVPLFPRACVVGLARFLGNVGFRLSRRDRRVAMANLDLAFGAALSRAEKEAIACAAFQTFTLVLLDLFCFGRRKRKRIEAHVKFDPSFDHYLKTAPVIAVTAHFGNWEIMGQAAAVHGEPPVSVAAPLPNRFVDRMLTRLREGTGQEISAQAGAVRSLMKALRAGGRTALLMDQNTLPRDGGEFVDLFGRPVPISKAAAGLASHTGAPVVFTYCVADADGTYTAHALPPVHARGERGAGRDLTQTIAQMLESVVRKHPGQWLWMYKRWKYIPQNETPDRYPFYARRLEAEIKGGDE